MILYHNIISLKLPTDIFIAWRTPRRSRSTWSSWFEYLLFSKFLWLGENIFYSVRSVKKIFNAFSSLLFFSASAFIMRYNICIDENTFHSDSLCSVLIHTNKYISDYYTVIFAEAQGNSSDKKWVNIECAWETKERRVYCRWKTVKYPFLSNWFRSAWCSQQSSRFLQYLTIRTLK